MIQVYTGEGKGKTTAALGLAIRAAGAGLKVYICQFAKARESGELVALKKIKNIKLERFGTSCFIRKIGKADIESAKEGLINCAKAIKSGKYDMVILDEINIASGLRLIDTEAICRLLKQAPKKIEIILTGRNAPKEIIACADLVSEIKEVKHYFHKGIKARRGIEF
ncbi:MAG: cob(I)yrinic acid a,c-diamide adenosyltransferase [Candidatus Omnitrophota bacterium]|nr:cob(I)yrinic acid a,c-diamide adenosyltransferase [Candidatus Omnitrophota bacterium]MBU1929244.1 cob(I)yrinic acid a,c-diamide adenosyltransferase [Candidatus Omnitrophota bacterium]MBU2034373.1 cob(I)yrinic acid a,c-diamide adenosyltransferase [Candidatus Omnitrophota bacterium]MBU2221552.1 cob(I)yrinic acid a,c-diamide adenosyltransferase [Candidatus Omnitrophota bacterium]MBU2258098.1 cob(I)yrinic acid a,c-diamide adenosyltransferase [Candidatus Omnitrophota bacterium]